MKKDDIFIGDFWTAFYGSWNLGIKKGSPRSKTEECYFFFFFIFYFNNYISINYSYLILISAQYTN